MIAPRSGAPSSGNAWTSHVDESSGATYYYNHASGATQWEMPAEMQAPQMPATAGATDFLALAMGGAPGGAGGAATAATSGSGTFNDPAASRAARQERRAKRKALRKERPKLLNMIMQPVVILQRIESSVLHSHGLDSLIAAYCSALP